MTKENLRRIIEDVCKNYTQSGFLDLASSMEEFFMEELVTMISIELEKEKMV